MLTPYTLTSSMVKTYVCDVRIKTGDQCVLGVITPGEEIGSCAPVLLCCCCSVTRCGTTAVQASTRYTLPPRSALKSISVCTSTTHR